MRVQKIIIANRFSFVWWIMFFCCWKNNSDGIFILLKRVYVFYCQFKSFFRCWVKLTLLNINSISAWLNCNQKKRLFIRRRIPIRHSIVTIIKKDVSTLGYWFTMVWLMRENLVFSIKQENINCIFLYLY